MSHFGLQIPSFTFRDTPDDRLFERIVEVAVAAEEAGFGSVWVMDHLEQIRGVGARDEPMLEGYTLLAALAARTSRVVLGTLVTGVTYRNPALLAKQVTTLDVVSAGRAALGIGGAWFEDEHTAYGFEFPGTGERLDRLEEAVRICRLLFTEDRPTFTGRYYRIEAPVNRPRPVQDGGPPILVGGGGEQRTLRIVAEHADMSNIFGGHEQVRRKLDVLGRHCEEVGRDPGDIVKTRLGTLAITEDEPDEVRHAIAERRGVDPSWLADATVGTADEVADEIGRFLDDGLDGLIFHLGSPEDLDTLAAAGDVIAGFR